MVKIKRCPECQVTFSGKFAYQHLQHHLYMSHNYDVIRSHEVVEKLKPENELSEAQKIASKMH